MLHIVEDHPYARAVRFYDEKLKAELEPEQEGRFVAIDVERALYAVSDDPVAAHDELRARGSDGPLSLIRVGSPYTFEMLLLE